MTTSDAGEVRLNESERSPARTIGEADIGMFAGLSGDFNAIHTDAELAAASSFGERVAHGLLVTSIASGLFTRTEMSRKLQPLLIALVGLRTRFLSPVFIGDTIHVQATVDALAATNDGHRSLARIRRDVLKSDGARVQEIVTELLLKRRTP